MDAREDVDDDYLAKSSLYWLEVIALWCQNGLGDSFLVAYITDQVKCIL